MPKEKFFGFSPEDKQNQGASESQKTVMTKAEQEVLDKFLDEQKNQKKEPAEQTPDQRTKKAEKEQLSKQEALEIIRQIERLLPEDDIFSKRWLETAKEAFITEKGNLEFATKELKTLISSLKIRAANEQNKKTKIKLQQAVALFGLLIAGYTTFSAEIAPAARAVEAMTEQEDKFNNYINDFRNFGGSADNLCAWISQNTDEIKHLDMRTILTAVKEKLQYFDYNEPLEALKVIDTLNTLFRNSRDFIPISVVDAQDVMNNVPGRTNQDWSIWLGDDKNWQKTNEALNFLSLWTLQETDSLPDATNLNVMEPVVHDALKRYNIENGAANRKKMMQIINEQWRSHEQQKIFGKDVAVIAVAGSGINIKLDSMVKMANPIANVPEQDIKTAHEKITKKTLGSTGSIRRSARDLPTSAVDQNRPKEMFSLSPDKNAGGYPIHSFKAKSVPDSAQRQEILQGIRSCPNEQLTFWFEGHMRILVDENKNPVERKLLLSTKSHEDMNATISALDLANAVYIRIRNNPNSKTTLMLGGCYSHIFAEDVYKFLAKRGLTYDQMPVTISATAPNVQKGKARTALIEKDGGKAMTVLSINLRGAMNQRNDRTSTKLLSLLKADEEAYETQGDFHSRFQIIFPIDPEKIKEKFPEADFGEEGNQKPPILEVGYLDQEQESEFFYA